MTMTEKAATVAAGPALFAPHWVPTMADMTQYGALASSWIGAAWLTYQLVRAIYRDTRGGK